MSAQELPPWRDPPYRYSYHLLERDKPGRPWREVMFFKSGVEDSFDPEAAPGTRAAQHRMVGSCQTAAETHLEEHAGIDWKQLRDSRTLKLVGNDEWLSIRTKQHLKDVGIKPSRRGR